MHPWATSILACFPNRGAGQRSWGPLTGGGSDQEIVTAAAIAAERDFSRAASNPVFVEAVRLLLAIPHAARSDDFVGELRKLDLAVGDQPEMFDILASVSVRLETEVRRAGGKDDFADLTSRALLSSLSDRIAASVPALLGSSPDDVRIAARSLSWRNGISDLTRAFFGNLMARSLGYWLDRTLSARIGSGRRFATVADRSAFDLALDQYVWEATRIIREFAPGWYGKRLHEDGTITPEKAAAFAHVAFKKINEELRLKRTTDA